MLQALKDRHHVVEEVYTLFSCKIGYRNLREGTSFFVERKKKTTKIKTMMIVIVYDNHHRKRLLAKKPINNAYLIRLSNK